MPEEAANGNQRPIDGGDRLTTDIGEVVPEIGNIPDRYPPRIETLAICRNEPAGELGEVGFDRPDSMDAEVVGSQELVNTRTEFVHLGPLRIIIRAIINTFWTEIRQKVDSVPDRLSG